MATKKKATPKGKGPAKRKGSKEPSATRPSRAASSRPPAPGGSNGGGRGGGLLGLVALGLLVVGGYAVWRSGAAHPSTGRADAAASRSGADDSADAPDEVHLSSLGTTVPAAKRVRVVARHPHQTDAFTQGLLWHEGALYESTGLEGRSSLRRVALDTGAVQQRVEVPEDFFAEGLARVGDRLFQLTWQDRLAFVYRLGDFEKVAEHEYEGEGWGLCYDGRRLIMSDGSHRLTFRDPATFEATGQVEVTKLGRPLRRLNELECVDGKVWANVWMTDELVEIDPETGHVLTTVDASGLLTPDERRGTDVLNGIAWLPDRGHFLITGKLWPWAFEVDFVDR